MLTSPSHRLSFDEFTLDTARCVLLRGEIELSLRRQSFEVLRYLAEHAGMMPDAVQFGTGVTVCSLAP